MDVEISNDNNQWILHLDYTHKFVYFPIQFKQYYDSLYFMELDHVDLDQKCIFVKFHALIHDNSSPFDHLLHETLQVMTGKSLLQVVSGKDIAIQHIMDKMDIINNRQSYGPFESVVCQSKRKNNHFQLSTTQNY